MAPRPSILAQQTEINDVALANKAVIILEAFARTGDAQYKEEFLKLVTDNKDRTKFVETLVTGVMGNKMLASMINSYVAVKNERPGPVELVAAIEDVHKVLKDQTFERDRKNLVTDYGEGFVGAIEPFIPKTQPVVPQPAAPQAPTTAPSPAVKKEEKSLESQAQEAVTALEAFIRTGDDKYRQQIHDIVQKNKDAPDKFFEQFDKESKRNILVLKVIEAYRENKGETLNINDLLAGIGNCHTALRSQAADKKKERDKLIDEYGATFVETIEIFVLTKSIPTRIIIRGADIRDNTISDFMDMLGITKVDKSATRERRLEQITIAVRDRFRIKDLASADVVAKALMYGYELLDRSDRKLFPKWLFETSALSGDSFVTQLTQLGGTRNTTLSYEYVKQFFMTWKAAKEAEAEKLADLKGRVDAFPPHIKETSSEDLAARIEAKATGVALGDLTARFEYLVLWREFLVKTKVDATEEDAAKADKKIAAIDKEIDKLYAWLGRLGLVKEGDKVSYEAMGKAIKAIQDEFVLIESAYMFVASERRPPQVPDLITHMKELEARNGMFFIMFKRHLSAVDAVSARVFTDVKPASPNYIDLVSKKISSYTMQSNVKRGAAQWVTDYYIPNMPSQADINQRNPIIYAYNALENLTPLAAASFFHYLEVSSRSGVGSMKGGIERRAIVNSVVQLNALNPLLIVKYFSAITKLAEVCENEPEAFRQALTELQTRIDIAASPVLSPVTPNQTIPFSNIRKIVEGLDSAFGEIIGIEKSSLAQYDRLDMLDDRVTIQQRPPHEIVQKPALWKPDLLVPKNTVPGFMSPYFLPPYMPTITPRMSFAGGGVYTNPQSYGGSVMLPEVRLQQIYPPVGAVQMAMDNYLDPQHPVIAISSFLPGVTIKRLSITRLMMEINKAFIPTDRPEYSGDIIAGGGGIGAGGLKSGDSWQTTGGGMGAVITPTGGAAIGGMKTDVRTFVGGTMVAVPIGFVPVNEDIPLAGIAWGTRRKKDRVIGTDTAVAGYEVLDGGEKKLLARAVQTTWTAKNPSQQLIVLNREELPGDSYGYDSQVAAGQFSQLSSDARQKILSGLSEGDVSPQLMAALRQGTDAGAPTPDEAAKMNSALKAKKAFMTARYFYVDKEGTVFELKGGQNDLVRILNFAAGYGNQQFMTPTTYAWNLEPKVKKGGYALAIDLGKTPILTHFQDMPLFVPETEQMPKLLQWTTSAATTVKDSGGPGVNIHSGAFYGQMLTIYQKPDTPGDKDQDFDVKDVEYRFRRVKNEDAWELSVGAGRGQTPEGAAYRGGFFLKTQHPQSSAGGGIYYEASATDLAALAVIQSRTYDYDKQIAAGQFSQISADARQKIISGLGDGNVSPQVMEALRNGTDLQPTPDEAAKMTRALNQNAADYVKSLHRIGFTLYGSKAGEDKFVMGALANVVPQFRQTIAAQKQNIDAAQTEAEKKDAKLKYDTTLYRFVGFLKGLESGARLDVARYSGYDRMMQDYEAMAAQVGDDPSRARDAMTAFGQKYAQQIDQIFNEYYLGIQVNNDFSLEASILSTEDAKGWASQFERMPDNAYARALYTWDTGFARAFASVPTIAPFGAQESNNVGVIGIGTGTDVLDSFFMQRAAADVGMIFARAEVENTDPNQVYTTYQQWNKSGWFVQGAARVFSSFIGDSKAYRTLSADFERYTDYIEKAKFSKLPAQVRSQMAENMITSDSVKTVMEGKGTGIPATEKEVLGKVLKVLAEEEKMDQDKLTRKKTDAKYAEYIANLQAGKMSEIPDEVRLRLAARANPNTFPTAIVQALRTGTDLDAKSIDPNDLASVHNVMKEGWFYDKKAVINKEFNGHLRAFTGASRYDFGDKVYYDIAAFVEMVDSFKGYLIYAKREEPAVFAGIEAKSGRVRAGVLAGVAGRGAGAAASVAYRLGETAGMAAELGFTGAYTGPTVPDYAMPIFGQIDRTGQGEWMGIVTFTFGAKERLPGVLQGPAQVTGPQTVYPGQGYRPQ